MTITTVLLDAGGVVLDESETERHIGETIVESLRPIVPGYSIERYREDVEEAVRCFCPKAYQYVIWKHVRPDGRRCEAVFSDFERAWRVRRPPLRIMDGIATEIDRLAVRFEVGLAGQYGAEILDLLERHGLLHRLAWRFTQDDFDITKPDPRYLVRIARRCGVSPEECLMVGDRIDKDVVPARMAGMRTVLVRTGLHRNQEPRLPEEVPDVELEGVGGLARAVERLAEELGLRTS